MVFYNSLGLDDILGLYWCWALAVLACYHTIQLNTIHCVDVGMRSYVYGLLFG